MTDGVAFLIRSFLPVTAEPREFRKPDDAYLAVALGVTLISLEGSLNLDLGALVGVLIEAFIGPEVSDIGGDGGVSFPGFMKSIGFVSGVVVINGEEVLLSGESNSSETVVAVVVVAIKDD